MKKFFCANLNFGIPIFSEKNLMLPKIRHTKLDLSYLNIEFVRFFYNQLNLEPKFLEVFYSDPFFKGQIHIDGNGNDITKINTIYQGKKSSMNWYSIKNNTLSKHNFKKTSINTNFISFNDDEVDLEYSNPITGTVLVNVGIPHNVVNYDEDRWCISLVYQYKNTKKRPTAEQSLDLFKKYII